MISKQNKKCGRDFVRSRHGCSKRKKKNKKALLWFKRIVFLISFVVVITAVVMSVNLLLKNFLGIRNITVNSTAPYSENEIIDASNIKIGDNIIFLNSNSVAKKIYDTFPYVNEISVIKRYPSSIEISVQGSFPSYCFKYGDEFICVSEKDKILEKSLEPFPEVLLIEGANISVSDDGKLIYENSGEDKKLFTEISESFRNHDLNFVKSINISKKDNIEVNYDNRIKIVLGDISDLQYKLSTAREIISTKINASEKGSLNLKNLKKENRSYFIPD